MLMQSQHTPFKCSIYKFVKPVQMLAEQADGSRSNARLAGFQDVFQ